MADITYDGKEVGFGSPPYDTADQFDSGFGAPWPYASINGNVYYNSAEASFADPYTNLDIRFVNKDVGNVLSDAGGEMLEVRGDFELLFDFFNIRNPIKDQPIGPFRAYFHPVGDTSTKYRCTSGFTSFEDAIFTNTNHKQMFFTTPVMPKGDYKLVIEFDRSLRKFQNDSDWSVIHRMRNDKTLSIRNNLPKWMDVGTRSDAITSGKDYPYLLQSNLSVLTDSIAELFDHMYHSNYTVTTSQTNSNNTTINVESTLNFPASGTVYLNDDQVIKYTGKTATSLTGVTGNVDIIEKHTRVYKRNDDINTVDLFYKIQNNGFYLPLTNFSIGNFEKAMREIELNERSSMQVIFRYFYFLFKKLNFTFDATVSGAEITSPVSATLNSSHVGRLCVIDDTVFYIQGIDVANQELDLDTLGCTYWTGADITSGTYSVEILPWIIVEDSAGRFHIEIERSVFNNVTGFIDKDYIDKNIFLDGELIENETNKNLNLDIFVAAGIDDRIILNRRTNDNFGTYFYNDENNPLITITPVRELDL